MASYTVQPGDSYFRIAGTQMGSQWYANTLAAKNGNVFLRPGMVIEIPTELIGVKGADVISNEWANDMNARGSQMGWQGYAPQSGGSTPQSGVPSETRDLTIPGARTSLEYRNDQRTSSAVPGRQTATQPMSRADIVQVTGGGPAPAQPMSRASIVRATGGGQAPAQPMSRASIVQATGGGQARQQTATQPMSRASIVQATGGGSAPAQPTSRADIDIVRATRGGQARQQTATQPMSRADIVRLTSSTSWTDKINAADNLLSAYPPRVPNDEIADELGAYGLDVVDVMTSKGYVYDPATNSWVFGDSNYASFLNTAYGGLGGGGHSFSLPPAPGNYGPTGRAVAQNIPRISQGSLSFRMATG